jgi:hypothetical protein
MPFTKQMFIKLIDVQKITDLSRFTPQLRSSKTRKSKPCKSKTKFPFKTMYFLGFRGLTTLSYIMYDYNSGGHTDLQSMYLDIYSIHTFLGNIFIYSNAINK